ncbi:MAG: GTPase HflX, partial [Bacteroidales bacterium]|nr:GTPase HflX [Bacteroidales bacterium]
VDISHPNFEDQIDIVNETLKEIDSSLKPTYMVFNKIDAFEYVKKEDDDLTPATRENISLEEWQKSWMSKENVKSIFISATDRTNLEEFKEMIYQNVKDIHAIRFPYNSFLY